MAKTPQQRLAQQGIDYQRDRPERWALLCLLVIACIAILEVQLQPTHIIGLMILGPLLAALRLSARLTGLIGLFSLLMAIGVGGTEDTHNMIGRWLTISVGTVLAMKLAQVNRLRERMALRTTAQFAITQAMSQASTLQEASPRMLEAIGQLMGWEVGLLWQVGRQGDVLLPVASWVGAGNSRRVRDFEQGSQSFRFARGEGLPGEVWASAQPQWKATISDQQMENYPRSELWQNARLRGAMAFPLLSGNTVTGVMEFYTTHARQPTPELLEMLQQLGQQIGLYIERRQGDERARDAEARRGAVMDASMDGIIMMDAEGTVTDFNPAAERIFGYKRAEAVGQRMSHLVVPPSLREAHEAGLARYLQSGEARVLGRRIEIEAQRKNGEIFPVELAIVRVEQDGPPNFTGFVRDLTAEREAQRELAEAQERFRQAFENAPIGVALINADSKYVQVNRALAEITGRQPSDMEGRHFTELTAEEDQERCMEAMQKVLRTGTPVRELEKRYVRTDGTPVWVSLNLSALSDDEGRPHYIVAQSVDISQRRADEQALREREARFRAVFDSSLDPMLILNDERVYRDANPAACRFFGLERKQLIGRRVDDFAAPDRVKDLPQMWDEFFSKGRWRGEYSYLLPDGRTPVVEVSATAHFLPGQHLSILRDVTERVRAERIDRFLAESGRLLAEKIDYESTLRQVASLAVPEIADWCALDTLDAVGQLQHVALAHVDPDKLRLVEEVRRRWPVDLSDPSVGGLARVLATGVPELYSEVSEDSLRAAQQDEEHGQMMLSIGMRSAMIVPLRARGRILGALTMVTSESGRNFTENDLLLAERLAERCALSVDNARLYEARNHQAKTLQASLLPPEIPSPNGLEAGARYHATGEGNEVGGDFYDLFALDEQQTRWAVVMGDVCGKGPDAAAVTALTRYTIRTLAPREQSPAQVLQTLNAEILRQRGDGRFCTVALAYIEPDMEGGAEMTLSLGGHPHPLRVTSEGTVSEVGTSGTMIGALAEAVTTDTRVKLEAGDRLVFYTDGVTDVKLGGRMSSSEDSLRRIIVDHAKSHPSDMANEIVEDSLNRQGGHTSDDVAVLVVGVPYRQQSLRRRFPATPAAVTLARKSLRPLERAHPHVNWSDVSLMISELTTNAVRHTSGDWFELCVDCDDNRLSLSVTNPGEPFEQTDPKLADMDSPGGRGLWIVSTLSSRWGVRGSDHTTVWCECDL